MPCVKTVTSRLQTSKTADLRYGNAASSDNCETLRTTEPAPDRNTVTMWVCKNEALLEECLAVTLFARPHYDPTIALAWCLSPCRYIQQTPTVLNDSRICCSEAKQELAGLHLVPICCIYSFLSSVFFLVSDCCEVFAISIQIVDLSETELNRRLTS